MKYRNDFQPERVFIFDIAETAKGGSAVDENKPAPTYAVVRCECGSWIISGLPCAVCYIIEMRKK